MVKVVMQERTYNAEQGLELRYKLDHSPSLNTIHGRIELNGKSIQRFAEKNGVICFFSDAWTTAPVSGPQVTDGKLTKDGLIFVWTESFDVGQTALFVNYEWEDADEAH